MRPFPKGKDRYENASCHWDSMKNVIITLATIILAVSSIAKSGAQTVTMNDISTKSNLQNDRKIEGGPRMQDTVFYSENIKAVGVLTEGRRSFAIGAFIFFKIRVTLT